MYPVHCTVYNVQCTLYIPWNTSMNIYPCELIPRVHPWEYIPRVTSLGVHSWVVHPWGVKPWG